MNDAPRMADEKAQIDLAREIEKRFRDGIARSGAEKRLIIAARILNTDLDLLWSSLGDEQTVERCLLEMERLDDLESLMMENVLLLRELDSLGRAASALAEGMPKRINEWVIAAMAEYDRFMSSALSGYSDLGQYASLGKNIVWHRSPYSTSTGFFRSTEKRQKNCRSIRPCFGSWPSRFFAGSISMRQTPLRKKRGDFLRRCAKITSRAGRRRLARKAEAHGQLFFAGPGSDGAPSGG